MDGTTDPVTIAEAARILACDETTVPRLLRDHDWPASRRLTRSDIEEVALIRWRLAHSRWPNSYWVTREQAAAILGVNWARVGQLVNAGLIPYERARTIRRQILFRRDQLTVVARARLLRWPPSSPTDFDPRRGLGAPGG